MKKNNLILLITFLKIFGNSVFAGGGGSFENNNAESLIKASFDVLSKTHDWKSKDITNLAMRTINQYPNTSKALTAKYMLVSHFQTLDTEKSLEIAKRYCEELISLPSAGWQKELARFDLVSIYGLQAKRDEQIVAAKETLLKLDIQLLENSTDEDFIRLKNIFPLNIEDIREALKMMLGSAYAETGRLVEADEVLKTITNKAFADAVKASINYQKEIPKMKEREKQRMKK